VVLTFNNKAGISIDFDSCLIDFVLVDKYVASHDERFGPFPAFN
jgi:hypothetical protein